MQQATHILTSCTEQTAWSTLTATVNSKQGRFSCMQQKYHTLPKQLGTKNIWGKRRETEANQKRLNKKMLSYSPFIHS